MTATLRGAKIASSGRSNVKTVVGGFVSCSIRPPGRSSMWCDAATGGFGALDGRESVGRLAPPRRGSRSCSRWWRRRLRALSRRSARTEASGDVQGRPHGVAWKRRLVSNRPVVADPHRAARPSRRGRRAPPASACPSADGAADHGARHGVRAVANARQLGIDRAARARSAVGHLVGQRLGGVEEHARRSRGARGPTHSPRPTPGKMNALLPWPMR